MLPIGIHARPRFNQDCVLGYFQHFQPSLRD